MRLFPHWNMALHEVLDKCNTILQQVLGYAAEKPKAALGLGAAGLAVLYLAQRPRNLPPGPKWLPILGTRFNFTWVMREDYSNLQEQYGDVVSYYQGGK